MYQLNSYLNTGKLIAINVIALDEPLAMPKDVYSALHPIVDFIVLDRRITLFAYPHASVSSLGLAFCLYKIEEF